MVPAAGAPQKRIEEFFGLASSGEAGVSIARPDGRKAEACYLAVLALKTRSCSLN